MENAEWKAGKKDILLIAGILAVAVCSGLLLEGYRRGTTREPVTVVTVNGEEYGRYPLDQDREERIELPDGSYNIMVIEDGTVDVSDASCPDRICVNHKKISKRNESIICLPNQVVVQIENGEDAGLDAVVN